MEEQLQRDEKHTPSLKNLPTKWEEVCICSMDLSSSYGPLKLYLTFATINSTTVECIGYLMFSKNVPSAYDKAYGISTNQ